MPVGASERTCARLFEEKGPRIEIILPGAKRFKPGQKIPKTRIGHFNLRDFRLTKSRIPEWMMPAWAVRPQKNLHAVQDIVESIHREQLDILFVSEIQTRESLENLAKELGDVFEPIMIEGNDPGWIDTAILIRKTLPFRATVQSHRALSHVYQGHTVPLFTRDLLILDLTLPGEDRPHISIAGSHLKAQVTVGRDEFSILKRTDQIEGILMAAALHRDEVKPRCFVVVGDLNADARYAREFNSFRNSTFRDAFDELGLPLGKRVTFVNFPRTGIAQPEQLDVIYVSREIVTRGALLSGFVVMDRDRYGTKLPHPQTYEERQMRKSDHNMVFIEVDLNRLP